jgi:hypothetical protein
VEDHDVRVVGQPPHHVREQLDEVALHEARRLGAQ